MWIVLAHLLRPQGRKGEVLAELFTDFPERFDDGDEGFLAAELCRRGGGRAFRRGGGVLAPVGKNVGRIVLHFAGVDTISDAETLAGLDVIVPSEERWRWTKIGLHQRIDRMYGV